MNTPHCYEGNKEIGICTNFKECYSIDYKDGQCKPNHEENDFKYCKEADG